MAFLTFTIAANAASIKGDVNNDGEVNIADVNAVINVILGGGGSNTSGDVNADGEINIADVNAIIDIILGGGSSQNNHEYVDLGLPSGTLWATCNVGANAPEEYGSYFAWGETAPKEVYNWETYKWCNGTSDTMTKYCTDGSFGTVDGKTELLPDDDAAHVNWGASWCIPTQEQCFELSNNCTWTWTKLNGVNGQLVTGPNGNTMFLPAVGRHWNDSLDEAGSWGCYWSRSLYSDRPISAFYLYFNSEDVSWSYNIGRYFGFAVRAVRVL